MEFNAKRISLRTFLIYSAVNILTYLFAHVAYLFVNDVLGEIFEYVSYYISKSVEFLAPPILATVALVVFINCGKGALVKFTLAVASARIFYSLPYYYIIFIYNHGYDSVESILLSLLASVLIILVTALGVFASLGIYYLVVKKQCANGGTSIGDFLPSLLKRTEAVDFLSPLNVPILTFALTRFTFSLFTEIADTVAFFIEYRSDFIAKEIITILANFILLFVLLIVSSLVASGIKNALIKKKDDISH